MSAEETRSRRRSRRLPPPDLIEALALRGHELSEISHEALAALAAEMRQGIEGAGTIMAEIRAVMAELVGNLERAGSRTRLLEKIEWRDRIVGWSRAHQMVIDKVERQRALALEAETEALAVAVMENLIGDLETDMADEAAVAGLVEAFADDVAADEAADQAADEAEAAASDSDSNAADAAGEASDGEGTSDGASSSGDGSSDGGGDGDGGDGGA